MNNRQKDILKFLGNKYKGSIEDFFTDLTDDLGCILEEIISEISVSSDSDKEKHSDNSSSKRDNDLGNISKEEIEAKRRNAKKITDAIRTSVNNAVVEGINGGDGFADSSSISLNTNMLSPFSQKIVLDELLKKMGLKRSSEKCKTSKKPKLTNSLNKDEKKFLNTYSETRKAIDLMQRHVSKNRNFMKNYSPDEWDARNKNVIEKIQKTIDNEETQEADMNEKTRFDLALDLALANTTKEEQYSSPVEKIVGEIAVPFEKEPEEVKVSAENIQKALEECGNMVSGQKLYRFTKKQERFDIEITAGKVDYLVEYIRIPTKPGYPEKIIAASTHEIGPAYAHITWNYLANLMVLITSSLLPANRIARMFSTDEDKLASSSIYRHLFYLANRFLPVYTYLFRSIANSYYFSGDDTKLRNIEFNNEKEKLKSDPETTSSWKNYSNLKSIEKAKKVAREKKNGEDLTEEENFMFSVNSVSPFVSPKKGSGLKTDLNHTVIIGRMKDEDPSSTVVFYRTHIGSFGNILEYLLETYRDKERKKVVYQSDLNYSNNIQSKNLKEKFDIVQAGCLAHVRRKFIKIAELDPPIYKFAIENLKLPFAVEKFVTQVPINGENILNIRAEGEMALDALKQICEFIINDNISHKEVKDAAKYFYKNYEAHTRYLHEPFAQLTNNRSERALRPDKLIEKSSMHRKTLKGAFIFDILSTITASCISSEIDTKNYILWFLKQKEKDIKDSPEQFTPYYFRENQRKMNKN